MKTLTLFATLVFLILFISSGNSQQVKSLECLDKQQSEFIAVVIEKFNDQLLKHYGEIDYKMFLIDRSSMSLPPDFFVTSGLAEFLNDNRNKPFFQDIWKNNDGAYELNHESKYFECLKSVCESETLCEVLSAMDQFREVSRGLIAGAIASELPDEQYSNKDVRIFIAINLYAELSIKLFDRFKNQVNI